MVSKVSVSFLLIYILISGCSSTDVLKGVKYSARIGNGKLAVMRQFPFIAYIRNVYNKPMFGGIMMISGGQCTGALINTNWVVTAAHCFLHNGQIITHSVTVKAGVIDSSDRSSPSLQEIPAAQVILHEAYDRKQRGDIALIKTKTSFQVTEFVKPIALTDEPLTNREKVSCIMMGFGNTQNGPNSRLFFIYGSAITCSEIYGSHHFLHHSYQDLEHVCVKVDKSETSGCPGDSGGPLVCANKLAGTLTGGVGFNLKCGQSKDNFALYQSVAHNGPWIRKHAGMAGELRALHHSDEHRSSAGSNAGIDLFTLVLAFVGVLQCAQ